MSTGSDAVDGVSPDLVELRAKAERHRSSHFVHVDPEAVLWLLDRLEEARVMLSSVQKGYLVSNKGKQIVDPLLDEWFASVEETP